MLDVAPLRALSCRGRPGSAALGRELDRYDPSWARANGPLEEAFYAFYVARLRPRGIPAPQLNAEVAGLVVDVHFADAGLVVELDGNHNHRTPVQRRTDMRRSAILRAHGIETVRYDAQLLAHEPELVQGDLLGVLRRRAGPT